MILLTCAADRPEHAGLPARRARPRVPVSGCSSAFRNIGLVMAALGSSLPDLAWFYFAMAQFPIYLLPALLKPLAKRLQPAGLAVKRSPTSSTLPRCSVLATASGSVRSMRLALFGICRNCHCRSIGRSRIRWRRRRGHLDGAAVGVGDGRGASSRRHWWRSASSRRSASAADNNDVERALPGRTAAALRAAATHERGDGAPPSHACAFVSSLWLTEPSPLASSLANRLHRRLDLSTPALPDARSRIRTG